MPYSTKLFADDTTGLMDQLGIKNAHFVGLSMGGAIVQQIAIHYPNRVRSLVLAATFAKLDAFGKHLLNFHKKIAEDGKREYLAESTLLWAYAHDFHEKRLADLNRIKELMLLNPQPLDAYIRQNLACQEHDTRDQLHKITAPCLILAGKEDILTPPTFSEILNKSIPHSELVILDHAGHGLFLEETEAANTVILDFLAEHGF
jgi:pimeloyl-ACP methyl ester carboxylesterase